MCAELWNRSRVCQQRGLLVLRLHEQFVRALLVRTNVCEWGTVRLERRLRFGRLHERTLQRVTSVCG